MLDFNATPNDVLVESYLLAEGWLNGAFPNVVYLQIIRNQEDVVFNENDNKTYNTVGTFPAKITMTPTYEIQAQFGVEWEKGEFLIMVPTYFLKQIVADIEPTGWHSLYDVMLNDDILQVPGFFDQSSRLKVARIKKITPMMWYGQQPLVVYFTCATDPGSART
jgi:hypothetical protein